MMKYVYVLLFCLDLALFTRLLFAFLEAKDNNSHLRTLALIIAGLIVSLGLLIFLLHLYTKQPFSKKNPDELD